MATPVAVSVAEWGPAAAPPLGLLHGGGDFAHTFDGLADALVEAGWRPVCWDQRGHGESAHAELYAFSADLRDAAVVLEELGGGRPLPLVGHSKGGVLAIELAAARPDLVAAVVSIDGFVRRRAWSGDVVEAATAWLDARRAPRPRRSGTAAELGARRAKVNPGVPPDVVRHLVATGARRGEDERWHWKGDPVATAAPPHGWSAEHSLGVLAGLGQPFLGLRAGVDSAFAGQPPVEAIQASLPRRGRLEVLATLGHFAHAEAPGQVASVVLPFLLPFLGERPT